jgi:isoaspartyl peptidase/L-asparaginase-like protein (Ntn-hydrolase superfamily)
MLTRREVLASAAAAAATVSCASSAQPKSAVAPTASAKPRGPVAISSGNGLRAVAKALEQMRAGADPMDAAIAGVNLLEEDPNDMTVGYGGIPNEEGVVQLDAKGDLGGCTTTSGLFFKMPGRVGDSPIIGAGCFTDNDVGSAGSTGRGEANILVAGGHTVVELMRNGAHPKDACLRTLERIARNRRPNFGIKFYAVRKDGAYGSASMWSDPKKPAQFAVADEKGARLESCAFLYEGLPAG